MCRRSFVGTETAGGRQVPFVALSLIAVPFVLIATTFSHSIAVDAFVLSKASALSSSPYKGPSTCRPTSCELVRFATTPTVEERDAPATRMAEFACNDRAKEELRGKAVLVTGATGGLGRALAYQLVRCQVSRLILSGRNANALQDVTQKCKAVNPDIPIHAIACDLSDPESVTKLSAEALKICPNIDVLINNGGVSSRSRFLDTSIDVDRTVMQINFWSGAALAKSVVPGMVGRRRGGRIIWISSVQGLVGIPNRSSYAASKFAVQGYCESIRAELAGDGIAVHAVSPGYIRTNLSRSAITGDGTSYGKTDPTTEAGADPNQVAVEILDNCAGRGQVDFVVAATPSAVAAIWLRLLCPSLLRYMLIKRYEKSQKQQDKNKED